jgi:hypothetical protein
MNGVCGPARSRSESEVAASEINLDGAGQGRQISEISAVISSIFLPFPQDAASL